MTKSSNKPILQQINYEDDDNITLIVYQNLLSEKASVINLRYKWKDLNIEERKVVQYFNRIMFNVDVEIN